jgi:hypothetical protein
VEGKASPGGVRFSLDSVHLPFTLYEYQITLAATGMLARDTANSVLFTVLVFFRMLDWFVEGSSSRCR